MAYPHRRKYGKKRSGRQHDDPAATGATGQYGHRKASAPISSTGQCDDHLERPWRWVGRRCHRLWRLSHHRCHAHQRHRQISASPARAPPSPRRRQRLMAPPSAPARTVPEHGCRGHQHHRYRWQHRCGPASITTGDNGTASAAPARAAATLTRLAIAVTGRQRRHQCRNGYRHRHGEQRRPARFIIDGNTGSTARGQCATGGTSSTTGNFACMIRTISTTGKATIHL